MIYFQGNEGPLETAVETGQRFLIRLTVLTVTRHASMRGSGPPSHLNDDDKCFGETDFAGE